MTVLFAEGFTGVPRGTTQIANAANPLRSLGYAAFGRYNGTTMLTANDTGHNTIIAADDVFADRNKLTISGLLNANVQSYFQQYTMPLNTLGYEKFVIGMMITPDTTTTSGEFQVLVSGPTQWPSSNSNFLINEFFAQLVINDVTADGALYIFNAKQATSPLIKKGKPTHIEILIEQDVDRCRVYVDGVLTGDATYTGTFAAANGGFSVVLYSGVPQARTIKADVSNIYVLGVDALHTGVLGPATRILEVAPTVDKAVEWKHPDAFASNAAVLQQMFNVTNPAYLTTGGPATDLYGGMDAVGQNAAAVHGAVFKLQAMTMAEGEHTVASAVSYNGTSAIGTKEYALALATLQPFVMDVSKNPVTNAKWTPQEIANAGFGFKLIK